MCWTFRDEAGEPIHSGSLDATRRIDFTRRIEGGPVDHGFERFFGTACCPTTDWLYAFIDNDRIPVPPTEIIDKSTLPKHPYAIDCRPGLIAPDFPMEEVDMVFLKKSRDFIAEHVRTSSDKPFFLFHATQAVHLPSFPGKAFRGKTKAGPHGDFIAELDDIVGELMQDLDRLGIAIRNHPSSYRYPTRWHVRGYGLFTANPFAQQDYDKTLPDGTTTLKQGEQLKLRHRFIFHSGEAASAKIEDAWQQYAKEVK